MADRVDIQAAAIESYAFANDRDLRRIFIAPSKVNKAGCILRSATDGVYRTAAGR